MWGNDYWPDEYWADEYWPRHFNTAAAPTRITSLLLNPGYWQETYFPRGYWAQSYWQRHGEVAAPTPTVEISPPRLRRRELQIALYWDDEDYLVIDA